MNDWIKCCDIFSPRVNLFFEGNSRYYSLSGVIMSFFYSFIIISFFVYLFACFVKGEEMFITFTNKQNPKGHEISGELSDKLFFYSIYDIGGEEIDPRILQVTPTFWVVNSEGTKIEYLSEGECSKPIKKKSKEFFDNEEEMSFKCLSRKDGGNITLYSTNSPYNTSFVKLFVTKCQNSTENSNHCLTDEEIEEKLKSEKYFLSFTIESVVVDNFKKYPFFSTLHSEEIPVTTDYANHLMYKMRKIRYVSDDGLLIKKKKIYENFRFDKGAREKKYLAEKAHDDFEEMILSISLSFDNEYIEKYQRSYEKLQNLFGDTWGTASLIHLVIEIIIYFFCKGNIIIAFRESNLSTPTPQSIMLPINTPESCVGIKNNNYVKKKSSFSVQAQAATIGRRKAVHFKFLEVLLYKCLQRTNCKFLREVERNILKLLDIRNIIGFSKDFDEWKFDKMIMMHKMEASYVGLLTNNNNNNTLKNKNCTETVTDCILDKSKASKKFSYFSASGSKMI